MSASRVVGRGLAGLVLVGAISLYLWPGARPQPAASGTTLAGVGRSELEIRPAPSALSASDFDHTIASSATLALAANELPPGRSLRIALELGAPSADLEPRPVRVIAPDGRLLHVAAPLDPDTRLTASLAIEPGWLTPGRYIVEVKTTERSHFPLRRYAIEIE